MDKLEKFIVENRESFNDAEPPEGHFDRFSAKLEREASYERFTGNRMVFLKIAAAILVLLTVSVFIFDFAADRFRERMSGKNTAVTLPADMQDAIQYYDNSAATKFNRIDQLACCGQDTRKIRMMAGNEMKQLDANSAELQKALSENPGDERIQAAIIQNHQMKDKMMNQVVKQMKRK
jgi:hypothetical protein